MRLFFSSHQDEHGGANNPEQLLNPADVMISFWNNQKTLHRRAKTLLRHRKRRRKNEGTKREITAPT
jgi:hypothetical protein